jgi:hypothetical protein
MGDEFKTLVKGATGGASTPKVDIEKQFPAKAGAGHAAPETSVKVTVEGFCLECATKLKGLTGYGGTSNTGGKVEK